METHCQKEKVRGSQVNQVIIEQLNGPQLSSKQRDSLAGDLAAISARPSDMAPGPGINAVFHILVEWVKGKGIEIGIHQMTESAGSGSAISRGLKP